MQLAYLEFSLFASSAVSFAFKAVPLSVFDALRRYPALKQMQVSFSVEFFVHMSSLCNVLCFPLF